MSFRINHNISSINAHRNLQTNNAQMSKTLEKLSSGLKINRASDSPAALVISEQMRAQIAGLGQAIDNSEAAISLVQTTEANMSEISNLLTGMRQLAIHAANEGVNDEVMLQADQLEIDNAKETIGRIANQAQFGTKKLLDGSRGAFGSTTGANLEFVSASLNTGDSREHGFDVFVTREASQSTITGSAALTQEVVSSGEELTLIENGKIARYKATADDTAQTMIQNLQNEIDKNGLKVDVSLDSGGRITATHREYGSDYKFQVSSSTAGVLGQESGNIMTTEAGQDIRGTINGESAVGKGQVLTGVKGAKCVDGLSIRYTGSGVEEPKPDCEVYDKEDPNASAEATQEQDFPEQGKSVGRVYVAQNALRFQVGANKNQTVGIALNSTNPEFLSRGVVNKSGFESLADVDVTSFQGAQDAIKLIDEAIDHISATRGKLGAFQKNTLESNLSNLRVQNENLISSESVIRDVDMAKEMATFTKNQIMSQSATAMLAQANQVPQNVLSLLR